jgi:hypothetical protein
MSGNGQQLGLFDPPRQRRGSGRESSLLLDAVVLLRRIGHRVYRAGHQHQVDGKLLSTAQLLELAATYRGRKAKEKEDGRIRPVSEA